MGHPGEGPLLGDGSESAGMKKHKERRKVAQAQKRAEYQKRKAKRALKKIKKDPTPTGRTSYRTMKF